MPSVIGIDLQHENYSDENDMYLEASILHRMSSILPMRSSASSKSLQETASDHDESLRHSLKRIRLTDRQLKKVIKFQGELNRLKEFNNRNSESEDEEDDVLNEEENDEQGSNSEFNRQKEQLLITVVRMMMLSHYNTQLQNQMIIFKNEVKKFVENMNGNSREVVTMERKKLTDNNS